MPALSFVHPEMLWLLALLGGIWGLALATPRRLAPWRHYGSLALRSAILTCLVFAVAGAQAELPVRRITTVFLLDGSDSVAPSMRLQAETFMQEALQAMQPDDQAAVIVFGDEALVDRAPSESPRLARITAAPGGGYTDIAEAIQLGLALFPADTQKRLVLLSDGGENAGSAIEAARLAAARGVPIEVLDLSMATGEPEAIVERLEAPARARDGQEVALDAVVRSSVAQEALVRLLSDSGVVEEQRVALAPGENRVRFLVKAGGSGFQRYRVQIEAAEDVQTRNNEAAALVQVQGPPRVLLVASAPGDAQALYDALTATRMLPELVAPGAMPTDLASLSAYEAVVLVNVPARALPVAAMAALPAYVRDLGKGLLMVGGEESFGVGGYGRTPIEEALPVYMDVRDREERPDLALVFVIDKSGSMDSCHCSSPDRRAPITGAGGFERKVDIAKQAVADAAALLSERDTVGVVTFDRTAYDTLPLTVGASPEQVVRAMADVQPRGSTNVRQGLLAAQRMLTSVDARLKHVILLTDGWGAGGSNIDLARDLSEQGITLSVVAAGGGSAGYLDDLAEAGGGRYYDVVQMGDVPQIFVQETIVTVGNYIVERPFTPMAVGESPVLAGLGSLPPLYGFNGSTIKESARRILLTDDEQPLLATWQFGLGRSAAFLSDTKGKWATDWLRWEGFPRFASQLIGWVLPVRGGQQATAEVAVMGDETMVRLTLGERATGLPTERLQIQATLIDSAGARLELVLPQTSPGVYQVRLPSPDPGTYIVQVAGADGDRVLMQEMAAMVVPYSAEYGSAQSNPALLERLATLTGGRALSSGVDAFAPLPGHATRARALGFPLLILALAMLPLDILIRRIVVRTRRG
ncbi:MAG: VWA domain-containing protein [Chloroflexi bacterium OHK40]